MTRHTGAEAVELLRKLDHYDLARRLQHYVNEINQERAELRERAEAAEARERAKDEALRFARPLVEKWCHYQGDHPSLFKQYLGPIDTALAQQPAEQPEGRFPQGDSVTPDAAENCETGPISSPQTGRSDDQPDDWADGETPEEREDEIGDYGQRNPGMFYCGDQADQPAQGERLDPHTLERAAQLADQRVYYLQDAMSATARDIATAIRNLRGGK